MTRATGAEAAFMKVTGMSYQAHDAADAWERICAFFGRHLG
jgi:dienelactone hydrolase